MFKLDFNIPPASEKINLKNPILSVGSCFSDNIGQKLCEYKFETLSNPFGTLYNPISIFKILSSDIVKDNLTKHQDVYFHWDTHSKLSETDPEVLKRDVTAIAEKMQQFVSKTKWLIITLGSAFVYRLKETGEVVANCHKTPQKEFDKELLTPSQIVESYQKTITKIREKNSGINVILTVSPVRHIRDGLHENNVSKGILHHAVAEIVRQDQRCSYFPSYEIMIDELRDYRFYEQDMIHPNQQATNYIWDQFIKTYMDTEAQQFIQDWTKVRSGLNHRPFHPYTVAHQKFLRNLVDQIKRYEGTIDIEYELNQLTSQLTKA